MNRDNAFIYLCGISSILGEIMEDISIDMYLGLGNGPSDFGVWLLSRLYDSGKLEDVLGLERKEYFVREEYRQYKNATVPELDLNNLEDLESYLQDRSNDMRKRWAIEKKLNGGFTLMDHYAFPEGLKAFLQGKD